MKTTSMRAGAWLCLLLLGPTMAAAQDAAATDRQRTIDLGPTTARAVTYDDALPHDPNWSPDGRWIVYVSDAEGPDGVSRTRLWVAPTTGSGPHRRLTSGHDGDEDFSDWYPAWSPDGEAIAFSSDRGGETHIWVVSAAGGELRPVTRIPLGGSPAFTSPRWSPDGRQLAYPGIVDGDNLEIFLVPLDGGERRRLTFDPTTNVYPDWSPDGRQLAYSSARGGRWAIWLAPLDGRAAPRLLETGLPEGSTSTWPRYSPDGRWIAFQVHLPSTYATTWVVPATGGQAVQITSATRMSAWVPAWSPDGRHLAVTGYPAPDVHLAVIPADSGAVVRLASAAIDRPAWSPDGGRLAYVTDDGQLAVIPAAGGTPRVVVPADLSPRRPSWSPDGGSLAFAMASADQQNHNLYTLRLDGGRSEPVTIGRPRVRDVAWSPDGEDIAFIAADEYGLGGDVWIVSAYGGRPRRLTDSPGSKAYPLWLEGGRRIGFYENSNRGSGWDLMSIDPRGEQPAMRLLKPPAGCEAVLPAPDGERAVFLGRTAGFSMLRLADLPDGVPRSLGVHTASEPVFSPDGERLAFIAGRGDNLNTNIWIIDVRPILSAAAVPQL